MRPLVGSYLNSGLVWKLRKAMYRLKAAQKAWQVHVKETMGDMGATRLRSEQNVYFFHSKDLCATSYTDGSLAVGLQDSSGWFYDGLTQPRVAGHLGAQQVFGKGIPFLGRSLQWNASGIHLQSRKPHIQEMVELLGLGSGKTVGTRGTSSPTS